jgi:hypothetical protein
MGTDAEPRPDWRHLLPIPGLDEDRVDPSRPIRVVVDVESTLVDRPVVQHLIWLLVTILTRTTGFVFASVAISAQDTQLLPGIDPSQPCGAPSLLRALKATASAFGPAAAPVLSGCQGDRTDLVLRIGNTPGGDWPGAEVLYVSAAGWTGAVTADPAEVPTFDIASENPCGPYVAACLAAGQAFMYARVRDHRLHSIALNAWTLMRATSDLGAIAVVDPGEPFVRLDHVLAGVGAVGTALLLTMWAYKGASGTIRAADDDPKGVDDTNLNRCLPFYWGDLGRAKSVVAAERLSGCHGLVIEPTVGLAQNLVGPSTDLISAVDTPDARQALQDKYPQSAVQASTSGLRLEMLRVDPTVGTACLRCFNRPVEETPDSQLRAQIAEMDEATVADHAVAVGTDPNRVREWGRVGGCGEIGDALLDRLRPSDGTAAQFSVGFMSVLAGVLLAVQVFKDAVRRAGDPDRITECAPLVGVEARFVANLIDPVDALAGVRRYCRDHECPNCRGVRAEVWVKRWTG